MTVPDRIAAPGLPFQLSWSEHVRTIQAILILVGFLIVAGFAFIAVEVFKRATDPTYPRAFHWAKTQGASTGGTTATGVPAPTLALPVGTLPAGTRLDGLTAIGSRLAVHAALPDGRQEIIVIEPDSGKSRVLLATGDGAAPGTEAPKAGDAADTGTMRPTIPHTP